MYVRVLIQISIGRQRGILTATLLAVVSLNVDDLCAVISLSLLKKLRRELLLLMHGRILV